jgi:uncharacterized membrane protein required for colicin V production
MNWLDIVLIALIAGIALLGMARGFGRTAFDALGLYGALWLASTLAPLLAAHLSLHSGGADVNRSWAFGLLFIVLGGVCLGIAWYCHGLTQFQAGMFDKLLALVAGAVAGTILAHVLVSALVTADPQQEASAALVGQGTVGTELYSFPTYHTVLNTITGAGTYRRELPNVGGK